MPHANNPERLVKKWIISQGLIDPGKLYELLFFGTNKVKVLLGRLRRWRAG
jgi:hypothetical protein